MNEYKGKISGIGNSITPNNEITADDLAMIRYYQIGWDYGVIDKVVDVEYINEVKSITKRIENGQLKFIYPEDYQGTTFSRDENNLIATTEEKITQYNISLKKGNLIIGE